MSQITKSMLDNWFNTPSDVLSWEAIAKKLSAATGLPVNEKQARQFYSDNGYNLRKRSQKPKLSNLIKVVDDSDMPVNSVPDTEHNNDNSMDSMDSTFDTVNDMANSI